VNIFPNSMKKKKPKQPQCGWKYLAIEFAIHFKTAAAEFSRKHTIYQKRNFKNAALTLRQKVTFVIILVLYWSQMD